MSLSTRPDFDPVTGKLTSPAKPSVLVNPLGLAPAGSKPGGMSAVDTFRTLFTGASVYGMATIASQVWVWLAGHPAYLGPHGPELIVAANAVIAAAFAVSHAVHAFAGDSKPRANPPA